MCLFLGINFKSGIGINAFLRKDEFGYLLCCSENSGIVPQEWENQIHFMFETPKDMVMYLEAYDHRIMW